MMTDKERQTLCKNLRHHEHAICHIAADEIEQLAKQVEWLRTELRAANIAIEHADPNRKSNYSYEEN